MAAVILITPMKENPSQTVADFFAAYPARKLKARQTLFWANEPIPSIAYIAAGAVGQYHITSDGQKLLLNIFKPGAFLPMNTVFGSRDNQYFFDTLEPLTYRLAPHEDVLAFMHANPDVTLDLISRVYRGIDGLLRRQAELMAGTAQSRLLFEILVSATRFGTDTKDGGYTIRLKTTELAERTGLSRETVSRQLKRLEEQELVRFEHGILHIPSSQAIEDIIRSL